jgi:hypothetical protein
MTTKRTEPAKDTLDTVAGKINALMKKSDDQRLSAAALLLEAKGRVEAGEAGNNIDWETWCSVNIKTRDGKPRSYRDVQRLVAIAESPDPQAALDADREKARAGMKATRARAAQAQAQGKKTTEEAPDPVARARAAVEALVGEERDEFDLWYTTVFRTDLDQAA